ncbi:MAG TPA: NADH:flavin oxidoreductase [Planctomycetaceae bacterium]|nr:NADH:flavin oxidoreductase [Planctomycetaceae bacterium]
MNTTAHPRLSSPLVLKELELANRLAVAPMTRVSSTESGEATELMQRYYSDFGKGGFGLVLTEGIYTDELYSQGYFHQPGLANERHVSSWKPIVDAVHEQRTPIIAQLMHAGALSQGNVHSNDRIGPSAVKPKGRQLVFYRGEGEFPVPKEMSVSDIEEAKVGFVNAAQNAVAAGFDGVEIHASNGYLLDQFLTVGVNLRDDEYGGPIENRIRLTVEVIQAVRSAVGDDFVVGARIAQTKVNDYEYRWPGRVEDAKVIFQAIAEAGLDYVHTTERHANLAAFDNQRESLAQLAKQSSGLPVIANGGLHKQQLATEMLEFGHADIISIGRGAIAQSDFASRVLDGRPTLEFDAAVLNPVADLANQYRVQGQS